MLTCRLDAPHSLRGAHVLLQERTSAGWSSGRAYRLDPAGAASIAVSVWKNATFRVHFPGSTTLLPATSKAVGLHAGPSGRVILHQAGAPEPAVRTPRGPQAVGTGANPSIGRLPDAVWRSMRGLSWRPGSPVGRSGLRYLTINYWGFDGYRYRGELILNAASIAPAAAAFTDLYHLRFPIRQMVLPDRFGPMSVSPHLGADDYRSMAADNTSGFNYRYVDGTEHSTRVLSPHAYGNAIDVNTWENPYVVPSGVYPDRYFTDRARSSPAMFGTAASPATRALTSRGFSWGASYGDWQHFQLERGRLDRVTGPGTADEPHSG